jgi:hypothetical protein
MAHTGLMVVCEMASPVASQPATLATAQDVRRVTSKFPDGNIAAEQGRVWKCNLPNGWWRPVPEDGSFAIRSTQMLSHSITMCTVAPRVLADLADG